MSLALEAPRYFLGRRPRLKRTDADPVQLNVIDGRSRSGTRISGLHELLEDGPRLLQVRHRGNLNRHNRSGRPS